MGSVVETNGSQEIEIYSSTDDLSKTIEANTRLYINIEVCLVGDSVSISTKCDDSLKFYI